jgi:hypothetical protein
MLGTVPKNPKIYHILHVDRLASVVREGGLFCDAESVRRHLMGTKIGFGKIKNRRLAELILQTKPSLHVGDCVPFYFCPRSVMLYIFWRNNHPELTYHGGQEPIVHLEFDLYKSIQWAQQVQSHWAFTNINAGSYSFEDFNDVCDLQQLNWDVISAEQWNGHESEKQAEFLVERFFPLYLVGRIGVFDEQRAEQVRKALTGNAASERIQVRRDWYY